MLCQQIFPTDSYRGRDHQCRRPRKTTKNQTGILPLSSMRLVKLTSCVSKGATESLSCVSQGRLQQGHCLPHYLFHIFTSLSIYFNRLILERMLKWEEAQTKIFLCKLLPELLLLSLSWTKKSKLLQITKTDSR